MSHNRFKPYAVKGTDDKWRAVHSDFAPKETGHHPEATGAFKTLDGAVQYADAKNRGEDISHAEAERRAKAERQEERV